MLKETRWQAKYIAEFFHFYAGAADKIAGEVIQTKPQMLTLTRPEPWGVLGIACANAQPLLGLTALVLPASLMLFAPRTVLGLVAVGAIAFVAALGIGVATYITIAESGGGSPACVAGGQRASAGAARMNCSAALGLTKTTSR